MNTVHLKIATRGGQKARLCDTCANGFVARGRIRTVVCDEAKKDTVQEEVVCLFIGRSVDMDVTDCNRYLNRFPGIPAEAAETETAWVA